MGEIGGIVDDRIHRDIFLKHDTVLSPFSKLHV